MKKRYYLILFLFFSYSGIAQSTAWDTLRYQKYSSSLIIGVFQSYRNFENSFEQFKMSDSTGASKNDYMAESRLVSGIEVIYDKFSFGLAVRSNPPKASSGKGNTRTFNTNFNFGGNIWYFQNTFRYFQGFYDNNTAAYDTTIRETGQYYQRPDIGNVLLRSKFLYFSHHDRFAFRSGYAGNYRQLRSAATWILSANLNYNKLSSDSSFFTYASRPYYGNYASMNGLRVIGASLNFGAAATLVILKGFFINGMFIVGPEQQWRKYNYEDGHTNLSYISISGDLRFSIGLNLRRCYFVAFNANDFSMYNSSYVGLTSSSISGGFLFGWRFHTGTPDFYKKFQETKFYRSI